MQGSRSALSGVLLAVALLAGPATAADGLVMGVHPYKPTVELHKMFKPIAEHVSRALGVPVELQFGKTYEDAAAKLGSGAFDFAFLGPNIYAKYGPTHGYRPLAQIMNAGKPTFHGVIVAKKGSGIRSIKDLKGKSFAFGDRNSTLTHVVPVYLLVREGIQRADLKKVAFLGTHDNLALNVGAGTFDAAGLMPDVAAKYPDLEVIASSPMLPEHVFAATSGMDPALAARIQRALLSMELKLMKGIKGTVTGMQQVHEQDFAVLREILEVAERQTDM